MTYRTKRTFPFGWLLNPRLIIAAFVALLVACAVSEAGEGPGPLNQAIRQELTRLGILDSTGGYNPPSAETPTLAQVLEAGSSAGGLNISGVGEFNTTHLGFSGAMEGGNFTTNGNLTINGQSYCDELTYTLVHTSITSGVGSPATIVADGRRINNSGTTVKAAGTLPAAAVGLHVWIDNVDSDGIRVNATGDDTIRLVDQTCATAGYFESVRVGSSLHLVAVSTTAWVAVDGITGTWRADSTTSAGFAFTPAIGQAVASTGTHSWDADADVAEVWTYDQVGSVVTVRCAIDFTGAPPTSGLTITALPNGWTINEAATGIGTTADYWPLRSQGYATDTSTDAQRIISCSVYGSGSGTDGTIYAFSDASGAHHSATVTQAAPWTWATGDRCVLIFSLVPN